MPNKHDDFEGGDELDMSAVSGGKGANTSAPDGKDIKPEGRWESLVSNHKYMMIAAVAAALLFSLLLGVIAFAARGCGKEDPDVNGGQKYTVEDFNYKTDVSACADSLNSENLTLVNKSNPLGNGYTPTDLVWLDTAITNGGKKIQLVSVAAEATAALIAEMKAEGYLSVSVTSAYRGYDYQKFLFDKYYADEKAAHPSWSNEQIRDKVLTYSAYPGTSEHQSGLCIDLWDSSCMSELVNYGSETSQGGDKGFAETSAFEWLKDNAHKFGFILRYPEDKTDTTGYSYESWHYRFVGIYAATKIYAAGICLEEYLASLE